MVRECVAGLPCQAWNGGLRPGRGLGFWLTSPLPIPTLPGSQFTFLHAPPIAAPFHPYVLLTPWANLPELVGIHSPLVHRAGCLLLVAAARQSARVCHVLAIAVKSLMPPESSFQWHKVWAGPGHKREILYWQVTLHHVIYLLQTSCFWQHVHGHYFNHVPWAAALWFYVTLRNVAILTFRLLHIVVHCTGAHCIVSFISQSIAHLIQLFVIIKEAVKRTLLLNFSIKREATSQYRLKCTKATEINGLKHA